MDFEDRYKYDSITVARYIAAVCNDNKITINITKIQKLLYILYGAFLAVHRYRLLDEPAQAWPYGPVFPKARHHFLEKEKEWSEITMALPDMSAINSDEEIKQIIGSVINDFAKYTAPVLSVWSHQENSPWDKATKREGFKWGDPISDRDIQQYFLNMIKQS